MGRQEAMSWDVSFNELKKLPKVNLEVEIMVRKHVAFCGAPGNAAQPLTAQMRLLCLPASARTFVAFSMETGLT